MRVRSKVVEVSMERGEFFSGWYDIICSCVGCKGKGVAGIMGDLRIDRKVVE